jgi:hypothetical protein
MPKSPPSQMAQPVMPNANTIPMMVAKSMTAVSPRGR